MNQEMEEEILNVPYDGDDEEIESLQDDDFDNTPIELFKIDENMPEELKQQLERFNEKTKVLNAISAESTVLDPNSDIDESLIDEDSTETDNIDDSMIVEEDISPNEIGDLF